MLRKVRLTLTTALFLVACLGLPVRAQTEPVEIRLKLARGEVLYYTMSGSTRMSFQLLGNQRTSLRQLEGRLAYRVFDVDPDGTMLVEAVLEDVRSTIEGRTQTPPAEPALFKITPLAKIVEQQMGRLPFVERLQGAIPSKAVSVGDSWNQQVNETIEGIGVQMTAISTLVGVDRNGPDVTARIRTQLDGNVNVKNLPLRSGVEAKVTGALRGIEDLIWSVDRGRAVSSRIDINVDMHVDVAGQGQSLRADFALVMAFQIDPLPAERVLPPAVGQHGLVAPGKAIGSDGLPNTFADLTKAWGEPMSAFSSELSGAIESMMRSDGGFRSEQVGWSTGLVAFLDPANRSTVLGLGIGRPDYRTDKGLGVGSSQGAVLFAHGMSPVRVEMYQPGADGGVRVLVYNDQGIAFALTIDVAQAKPPGGHAPIGAVDWMVIFPPGTAGKIFPMP